MNTQISIQFSPLFLYYNIHPPTKNILGIHKVLTLYAELMCVLCVCVWGGGCMGGRCKEVTFTLGGRNTERLIYYRVNLVVVDLVCVDLYSGCSIFCPILLGQMGI